MASVRPIAGYTSVTVERDVPARMRDGVTLYADVYRPAAPGRYPVILFRHPYDKTPVASLTWRTLSPSARAASALVTFPAMAACTRPGRRASLVLIVRCPMGDIIA